jgi:hypothetical protein
VLLVGGGSENYNDWSDTPYAWLVQQAPNKKILVLHYSTVSTFLPDYFKSLGAVQSVSTVINSVTANDSAIYKMILEYDGIFLRGGDQWEYVKQWKGTLTEQAIDSVFRRGGAVGGTSAGAMVLSKIIADAKTTSVDPRTSLRTPFSAGITFTEDFLGFASGILCDTHFYERGRLSRLLAMLAMYHHQSGKWITGVGIDDATALGITCRRQSRRSSAPESSRSSFRMSIDHGPCSCRENLSVSPICCMRQFTSKVGKSPFPAGWSDQITTTDGQRFTPEPVSSSSSESDPRRRYLGPAEWNSPSGSLTKFIAASSGDTISIITSNAAHPHVISVRDLLTSKGIPSSIIPVSPALRNTESNTSLFLNRSSIIVMNVATDSLSFFTDSASISGNALRECAGRSFLLLGDAASLAGSTFVNKLEVTTTAAYRGRLTVERGLELVKGMMVLPRLYESDSYVENRSCALPWGIGKSSASFGVFLDNGSHCIIENGTFTAYGTTPLLFFDLRSNSLTAFPSYVASGGIGPRQNAAFNAAKIIVLPDSTSLKISAPSDVSRNGLQTTPTGHELLNIYPNPFNPSATVEIILRQKDFVTITLSDILGRTLRIIAQQEFESGNHRLVVDGSSLTSGHYFISVKLNGTRLTKRAVLIK